MAFFLARLNVGDYDAWKPAFDQDLPGARRGAKGYRIFRNESNPGEVYLLVEFPSVADAKAGCERLLASGVLDRFADKTGPTIIEEAEAVSY